MREKERTKRKNRLSLGIPFEKSSCCPAAAVVINRSCNWRFNSSLGACIMGSGAYSMI